MQHTANSSQHFVPRIPGSLHTPTQSFSDPLQSLDSEVTDWSDKQVKDIESAKNRLLDHKFNIRDYADPLLPRQQIPSHYNPKGVTAEMEKYLLEVIAQIKAENARGAPLISQSGRILL